MAAGQGGLRREIRITLVGNAVVGGYARSQAGLGACSSGAHARQTMVKQGATIVRQQPYRRMQNDIRQGPAHAASGLASPAATTTMAGFKSRPFSVQAALQA